VQKPTVHRESGLAHQRAALKSSSATRIPACSERHRSDPQPPDRRSPQWRAATHQPLWNGQAVRQCCHCRSRMTGRAGRGIFSAETRRNAEEPLPRIDEIWHEWDGHTIRKRTRMMRQKMESRVVRLPRTQRQGSRQGYECTYPIRPFRSAPEKLPEL